MTFSFATSIVSIPVSVLSVIPLIGLFISLGRTGYLISIYIRIVQEVYQLSTGHAAAVVLIPVAVVLIIAFVIVAVTIASLFTGL